MACLLIAGVIVTIVVGFNVHQWYVYSQNLKYLQQNRPHEFNSEAEKLNAKLALHENGRFSLPDAPTLLSDDVEVTIADEVW